MQRRCCNTVGERKKMKESDAMPANPIIETVIRTILDDYDTVLNDVRVVSTWGGRNQEILRIALSKLDQGHIEMFRAALVGALLPRVNPEQFIKAVQTAEFVNGGKHGTR